MVSHFEVGQEIKIEGVAYTIAEHPGAPHIPYGQEGRQGIVYQLLPKTGEQTEKKALKIFRKPFRDPATVSFSEKIQRFSELPGLTVCQRSTITPQKDPELLAMQQDLLYAVMMPWIDGPTWLDVMVTKEELSQQHSLMLASALIRVLAAMEQQGLAHCDLSGSNLLLPYLAKENEESSLVELVDIEQMYAPGLNQPNNRMKGSPGYSVEGQLLQWGTHADRFAGSILLTEILCWCDENIRQQAWGESYFAPDELQQQPDRYDYLIDTLQRLWGNPIAALFRQAWKSDELHPCPTFGEWMIELNACREVHHQSAISISQNESLQKGYQKIQEGIQYERQGDLNQALQVYYEAKKEIPPHDSLADELTIMIELLEARIQPSSHSQKKQNRQWLPWALPILTILVGVLLYYPLRTFFLSEQDNIREKQVSQIINQHGQVVLYNNQFIQKYDVINRLANQLQSDQEQPTHIQQIIQNLQSQQDMVRHFQNHVEKLSVLEQQFQSVAQQTHYTDFYKNLNRLIQKYKEYGDTIQQLVHEDLQYFQSVAQGKSPASDTLKRLFQLHQEQHQQVMTLERQLIQSWEQLH